MEARCRNNARRAQFPKAMRFRFSREHLIHGDQHLISFQCWPQVAKVIRSLGRFRSPGCQHAIPIHPRYPIRWANLLGCQGHVHGRIQLLGPAGMAPRLFMGNHQQLHGRQIVALEQCRNLGLLGMADDLVVGAYDGTDGRIGQHLIVMGLPAEQARYSSKRQLLGQ
jgi:hypothetical protein